MYNILFYTLNMHLLLCVQLCSLCCCYCPFFKYSNNSNNNNKA